MAVADVTAAQAVAYRVAAHHLHVRREAGEVDRAAGVAGVQDTPPGVAAVALAARVDGIRWGDVQAALVRDRSLVRVLGPRGAAHIVPTANAVLFGPGSLGATEVSLQAQLAGAWLPLRDGGWAARDALTHVSGVMVAVLADGEPRRKGELSEALHGQLPPELEPWCERCGANHVPDQLFRLAGVAGAFCYGAPRQDGRVLVDVASWLGGPLGGNNRTARQDLTRRFVHAYGPVAPDHLLGWTGIGRSDARTRFDELHDELVEVRLDGATAWMLRDDVDTLSDPPPAEGVRLLPPGDPFLHQRDRATLLGDRARQRMLWRSVGSPGLVLLRGRPVGIWRGRVRSGRLVVTVDAFARVGVQARRAIEDEAAMVAPFRDCESAEVTFGGS